MRRSQGLLFSLICLILLLQTPLIVPTSQGDSDEISMDSNPTDYIAIPKGGSGTITLDITKINATLGAGSPIRTVSLSIDSATLPTNIDTVWEVNSFSAAELQGTTSKSVDLTIKPKISAVNGSYNIVIRATLTSDSNDLTTNDVTKTITLYISDFELSSSSYTITLMPGETEEIILTAKSLNRFSGSIDVNLPTVTGVVIENVGSLNVPEGTQDTTNIRFTINNNAVENGNGVPVDITGKVGNLNHTITITLKIIPNTLQIEIIADPNPVVIFQESVITATIKDGNGIVVSGASVTLSFSGGNGTFSNSLSSITGITDSNGKFSDQFYVTKGEKIIKAEASKTNYGTSSTTITLGIKGHFELSVDPDTNIINAGDSKTLTVSVRSIDGFNQPVKLSYGGGGVGITVEFIGDNIVTPTANGVTETGILITLSDSVDPKMYSVQIIGEDTITGNYEDTASFSIDVPTVSIGIIVTPDFVTINQGEEAKFKITLVSKGGFDGNIDLRTSLPDDMEVEWFPDNKAIGLADEEIKTEAIELRIKTTKDTESVSEYPVVIAGSAIHQSGTRYESTGNTVKLTVRQLFNVTFDSTQRMDKTRVSQVFIDGFPIQKEQLQEGYTISVIRGTNITMEIETEIISEEEGIRYKFNSWNDGSELMKRTETIMSERTFKAEFDKEFLLELRSMPIGITKPIGEGWYKEYTELTISTMPIVDITDTSRYKFQNWDGAIFSENQRTDIVMDEPKEILANYILQYKISRTVEPKFLKNLIDLIEEEWVDRGADVDLIANEKVNEYGFKQWIIESSLGKEPIINNPWKISINEPINIILEYELLPDVQILSIDIANNGYEGEYSYMWLNLANNHLRGGDIILKVETNIDGLIITPSKIEMFIDADEERTLAFIINYTKAGSGTIKFSLEKTAQMESTEFSKEFKIFSQNEKRIVINMGKSLSAKNLPEFNNLMEPNERVIICATEIIEQTMLQESTTELEKARAILKFLSPRIASVPEIQPRSVSELIREFGVMGCANSDKIIEGDSRTSQILYGGLLRSIGIEVRPVIGVLGTSTNMITPNVELHTWLEVKVDNQWVIIDPLTGTISIDLSLPENLEGEFNQRGIFNAIPEQGGILSAMMYQCITICNIDITESYTGKTPIFNPGSIIFVEGDVNINILDSNRNFITNGTLVTYSWSENNKEESLSRFVKLIMLSEGVDIEYISINIEGQLGKQFQLNVLNSINFEYKVTSISPTLFSKSKIEYKIVNEENKITIYEFVILEFDQNNIDIISTSSIIRENHQKRLTAIEVTVAGNKGNQGTIIITIPREIFSQLNSETTDITVIMDEKRIPVEIIDDDLVPRIKINYLFDMEKEIEEKRIVIFLKTYKVSFELRDPLNRIINNAEIKMIGETENRTQTSNKAIFEQLHPGNYKFAISYRGQLEEISKRINDDDVDIRINLFRSDSMVSFITAGIFIIITIIAYGVQIALSKVIPEEKKKSSTGS